MYLHGEVKSTTKAFRKAACVGMHGFLLCLDCVGHGGAGRGLAHTPLGYTWLQILALLLLGTVPPAPSLIMVCSGDVIV
jgi:hypothetical protein